MYSFEQYERCFGFRKQGLSYKKIADNLDIRYPKTVRDWLVEEKIPKGRFLDRGYSQLTPELGYILGVIEGEGYVTINKINTKGNVGLEVIDKDFAEEFKKNLEKWSGLEVRFGFGNSKKLYYSMLGSLRAAQFLKSIDLKDVLNSTNIIKVNFLRGFFDAEGNVSGSNLKTPRIATRFIACFNNNYELLLFIKKLLLSLDIKVQNIDKRTGIGFKKESMNYRLRVGGRENLQKFYEKIGFSIKRKQNKLKEILRSYEKFKDKWWSKEEKNFAISKSKLKKYKHTTSPRKGKINNIKISSELNKRFHSGRKIRTAGGVRCFLSKTRQI